MRIESAKARTWGVRIAASILFLATHLSCGPLADSATTVEEVATNLELRTVPPGSRTSERTGPDRTQWGAEWSWEFKPDRSWEEYKSWVVPKMSPEFKFLRNSESRLVFSRMLEGDAHSVIIERLRNSDWILIRVTFVSFAD